VQAALLANPIDCEAWTTLSCLPVTRGDSVSLRVASTLARLALSGSISSEAADPVCSRDTTAHALTVRPRALVRITGKLQNTHKVLMHAAWRKAVALDGSAGNGEDRLYFRHALVRGFASLASELCDWSSYEDAGRVIGWAVQLQEAQGGDQLLANMSMKSLVAQGAVNARDMDLGLSLWKEIVGPLHTPGSGQVRDLEIRGRCLLLHKLQFAAECVALNYTHLAQTHPHTQTFSCFFPPGTTTPTSFGTASSPASSSWRTVLQSQSRMSGRVT
jgi:hypothetical protein